MIFIVYLTGLFMSCYLLFATLIHYFTFSHKFHVAEYCWPPLLFLTFIFFLFDLKILKSFSTFKVRKYANVIAVFFLTFIGRLSYVNEASVWLDEHIQAYYSATSLPVAAGAIQHQPPGDMVLTNLGLWISDFSVWGLRFHSCLFSALAAAALFALTKYFSKSRLFALLCTLFFSFHHIVFRYGYEARPISFGLFMELLFLGALIAQMKQISEKGPAHNGLYLSGITFIYLNSLGLQPPFIVGLSVVFFAVLSCFKREYLKTTGLIALGLALFIPLQLVIINLSPPRFTLTNGLDIARAIAEFTYTNFGPLSIYYNPIGYICIFLLFFYGGFLLYRKKPIHPITAFLVFLTIFFPVTLIPYFMAHIAWELNNYYLVSFLPLVFLLFSALWGHLQLSGYKRPWISSLLSICVFAAFTKSYDYKDRYGPLLKEHPDLKSAFSLVQKNMDHDDLLLSFCLTSVDFCAQWIVAKPFYFKGTPIDSTKTASVEVYRKALASGAIGKNIFFLYQNEESSVDPGENNLIGRFNKALVYKVSTNSNPAKAVIEFFNPYVQAAHAERKIYPEALAYLIVSYEHLGDEKTKMELLNIYKNGKSKTTPENKYLDKQLEKLESR